MDFWNMQPPLLVHENWSWKTVSHGNNRAQKGEPQFCVLATSGIAATSGASAGGGWDIGDGEFDADSFVVARTHLAQHSASLAKR